MPLGREASAAGVAPLAWALVVSVGVVAGLIGPLLISRQARWPNAHRLRYFGITAIASYAVPNLLLFAMIPQVGTGFAGIMLTISPIVTLLFSRIVGLKPLPPIGIIGIVIGFIGALLVAGNRGGLDEPASWLWVALALLLPVSLAIGNIYRTVDWPPGASPLELAVGSHATAALLLALLLASAGSISSAAATPFDLPGLALLQMLAGALMFSVYFRLQDVGGPVYLSQIGYVAAAIGLAFGTLVFGESYGMATWFGAVLITIGVTMTTWAQQAPARQL